MEYLGEIDFLRKRFKIAISLNVFPPSSAKYFFPRGDARNLCWM
jgi:hypothetical protein